MRPSGERASAEGGPPGRLTTEAGTTQARAREWSVIAMEGGLRDPVLKKDPGIVPPASSAMFRS